MAELPDEARIVADIGSVLQVFEDLGLRFHKKVGNFAFCPTGERYQTVCSGGVKVEGTSAQLFATQEKAISAYRSTIEKLIVDCRGKGCNGLTVYWRRMPELLFVGDPDGPGGGWVIYSRLRISNKPRIQSADFNLVNPVQLNELPIDGFNETGGGKGVNHG